MNDQYRTPGQLIKALLVERDWTQLLLAAILEMDENALSQIVLNRRPVTAELSIALADIFDIPAERFLQLQANYDLAKAEIEAQPNPERLRRSQLFAKLPVREMIKRQWIGTDDVRDLSELEKAVSRFFGTDTADSIDVLPHAAKKVGALAEVTPVQLAWIYRVKQIAEDMQVAKFTAATAQEAVARLGSLRSTPEGVGKVPRVLLELGIRYLIVESLPKAKIDGVCLWLDENSPVIGMSLRYDRIDNFWFVLRHELEHVIRCHGQSAVMLDAELEGERAGTGETVREEERIANEAAGDFCVPRDLMDKYIACQSPYFDLRDFLGFANVLNVHPGVVAGQLHRRTERYELFRKYLAKIHGFITPNARIDGWGKVALPIS